MRTLAIFNMKGGVAKTTTACNTAHLLAKAGWRVLLLDNDAQGNASSFFQRGKTARYKTMADVFLGAPIQSAIQHTNYENLDIVVSNMKLADANEKIKEQGRQADFILYNVLASVARNYDIAIIDCAPGKAPNIDNALIAATDVLVPLEIDGYSLEGLHNVQAEVLKARAKGSHCKILGILICKFEKRTNLGRDGLKYLHQQNWPVFKTVIHASVKVKEAVFKRLPLTEYSKKCRPAADYKEFVRELVPKLGTTPKTLSNETEVSA